MKFISIVLVGFFGLNSFAANTEFIRVDTCTPASPAQYIVRIDSPQNLSFVDGFELSKKLSASSVNTILEIRNVVLTYFVVQTSDLEILKGILRPYLAKSEIGIECDSPGNLE